MMFLLFRLQFSRTSYRNSVLLASQPLIHYIQLLLCFRGLSLRLLMGACVVDHFAADEGFQHLERENLRRQDFPDVFRDDRQVGQFAFFERTLVLLLKLGVSRLKGVTPQRFFERKPLLWVPAAWR